MVAMGLATIGNIDIANTLRIMCSGLIFRMVPFVISASIWLLIGEISGAISCTIFAIDEGLLASS